MEKQANYKLFPERKPFSLSIFNKFFANWLFVLGSRFKTGNYLDIITDDKYRKESIEKVEAESEKPHTPETIDIEKPGKYKIDLKGLLEEEPIIIQKDGSYTIHLPSIFKMIDKEK